MHIHTKDWNTSIKKKDIRMKRNPNSAGETEQEPEKRKRQKKSENQDDTSLFNWFVVGFAEGSKNVSVKSEENNTDL